MLSRILFVLLLCFSLNVFTAVPPLDKNFTTEELVSIKPKISIVVDDLGDNSIIAKQIATLPAALTLAILPHTPFAQSISELASKHGHEVIMHIPMEALSRPDLLGPGALFEGMEQQQFEQTFLSSAQTVPNLVGFNNHMGSLLTQSPQKMRWLMNLAQQKHWYFLDSKTSESSIAQQTAEKFGLANIGRDIFLDHHNEKSELPLILQKQFEKLKRIAKSKGHVVAICHPYQETFNFLAKNLPELEKEFEVVHLSELLNKKRVVNTTLAKSN